MEPRYGTCPIRSAEQIKNDIREVGAFVQSNGPFVATHGEPGTPVCTSPSRVALDISYSGVWIDEIYGEDGAGRSAISQSARVLRELESLRGRVGRDRWTRAVFDPDMRDVVLLGLETQTLTNSASSYNSSAVPESPAEHIIRTLGPVHRPSRRVTRSYSQTSLDDASLVVRSLPTAVAQQIRGAFPQISTAVGRAFGYLNPFPVRSYRSGFIVAELGEPNDATAGDLPGPGGMSHGGGQGYATERNTSDTARNHGQPHSGSTSGSPPGASRAASTTSSGTRKDSEQNPRQFPCAICVKRHRQGDKNQPCPENCPCSKREMDRTFSKAVYHCANHAAHTRPKEIHLQKKPHSNGGEPAAVVDGVVATYNLGIPEPNQIHYLPPGGRTFCRRCITWCQGEGDEISGCLKQNCKVKRLDDLPKYERFLEFIPLQSAGASADADAAPAPAPVANPAVAAVEQSDDAGMQRVIDFVQAPQQQLQDENMNTDGVGYQLEEPRPVFNDLAVENDLSQDAIALLPPATDDAGMFDPFVTSQELGGLDKLDTTVIEAIRRLNANVNHLLAKCEHLEARNSWLEQEMLRTQTEVGKSIRYQQSTTSMAPPKETGNSSTQRRIDSAQPSQHGSSKSGSSSSDIGTSSSPKRPQTRVTFGSFESPTQGVFENSLALDNEALDASPEPPAELSRSQESLKRKADFDQDRRETARSLAQSRRECGSDSNV